jgi:glycosyltransferase involved in cell wall biosynthesis
MRDLYSLADAFVLPTRGEGWGIPVAEAMAMGLPVIVTNYSGPTEYANEENAYLLPVTGLDEYDFAVPDESALVELLWQVVADSLLQVGNSGSSSSSVPESSNLTKSQIKGKKARESMQRLSGDFVAEVIKGHLREEAESRGWKF